MPCAFVQRLEDSCAVITYPAEELLVEDKLARLGAVLLNRLENLYNSQSLLSLSRLRFVGNVDMVK